MTIDVTREHPSEVDERPTSPGVPNGKVPMRGMSAQAQRIVLLIGASLALSAAATSLAYIVANRERLRSRRRLASVSRRNVRHGYIGRLARAYGQSSQRLRALVVKR